MKQKRKQVIFQNPKIPVIYFNHIYMPKGFSLAKALFEGETYKSYKFRSTHACLYFGYWCWKNAWDHPQYIIPYFKSKIKKLFKHIYA